MKSSFVKSYTKVKLKENDSLDTPKVSLREIKWPVEEPWKINNSRYHKLYLNWMEKVEFLHILNNKNISKIKIQNLKPSQLTKLQNSHNDMAFSINKMAKLLKLSNSFLVAYVDYLNSSFTSAGELFDTTANYKNRRIKFQDIKGPITEPSKILCRKYQKVFIEWLELINDLKKINNHNITMIRSGEWEVLKIRRESNLYNQKVIKVNEIAEFLQLASNFIVAKVDYLNEDYINNKAQIDTTVVDKSNEIDFDSIVGPIYDPSRVNNHKYQRMYSYWLEEINNLKILHNRNIDLITDGLVSEQKIRKIQNEYNYLVKDVNDVCEELRLADRYLVAKIDYFSNVYGKKYYQEDSEDSAQIKFSNEAGVPFIDKTDSEEFDLSDGNFANKMEAYEIIHKKVIRNIQDTQNVLDDFVGFEEYTIEDRDDLEVTIPSTELKTTAPNDLAFPIDTIEDTITNDEFNFNWKNVKSKMKEAKSADAVDEVIKEQALFDWNGNPVFDSQKLQLTSKNALDKLDINNVYDQNFELLFADDKDLPCGYSLFNWLGDQVYDEQGNKLPVQLEKLTEVENQIIEPTETLMEKKSIKLYDWHGNPVFDINGKQLENDGQITEILETEIFDINGHILNSREEKFPHSFALFNYEGFKVWDILKSDKNIKDLKGTPAVQYYQAVDKKLPGSSTEMEIQEANKKLVSLERPMFDAGILLFDKKGEPVFDINKQPLQTNGDLLKLDYINIFDKKGKRIHKKNKAVQLFDINNNLVIDSSGKPLTKIVEVAVNDKRLIKFEKNNAFEDGTLLFNEYGKPVFDENRDQLVVSSDLEKLDESLVFDKKGKPFFENRQEKNLGLALFNKSGEQVYDYFGAIIKTDILEVGDPKFVPVEIENFVEKEFKEPEPENIDLSEVSLEENSFEENLEFTRTEEPVMAPMGTILFTKKGKLVFDVDGQVLQVSQKLKSITSGDVFDSSFRLVFDESKKVLDKSLYNFAQEKVFDKNGDPVLEFRKIIDENSQLLNVEGIQLFKGKKQPLLVSDNLEEIDWSEVVDKKGKQPYLSKNHLNLARVTFTKSKVQVTDLNGQKLNYDEVKIQKLKETPNLDVLTNPEYKEVVIKTPIAKIGTPIFTKDGKPVFDENKNQLVTTSNLKISDVVFDSKNRILFDMDDIDSDKSLFDKNGIQLFKANGKPVTKEETLKLRVDQIKTATKPNGEEVQFITTPVIEDGQLLFTKSGKPVFDSNRKQLLSSKTLDVVPETIYDKKGRVLILGDDKTLVTEDGSVAFDDKGQQKVFKQPIINFVNEIKTELNPEIEKDEIKNTDSEKTNSDEFDFHETIPESVELSEEKDGEFENDLESEVDEESEVELTNIASPKEIFVESPIVPMGTEIFTRQGKQAFDSKGFKLKVTKETLIITKTIYNENGEVLLDANNKDTNLSLFSKDGELIYDSTGKIIKKLEKLVINSDLINSELDENGNKIEYILEPILEKGQPLFTKNGEQVFDEKNNPLLMSGTIEPIRGNIFNSKGDNLLKDPQNFNNGKALYSKMGKLVIDFTGTPVTQKKLLISQTDFEEKLENQSIKEVYPEETKEQKNQEINSLTEDLDLVKVIVKNPVAKIGEKIFTKDGRPVFKSNGEPLLSTSSLKINEPVFDENSELLFKPEESNVDKSLFDSKGTLIFKASGKPVIEEKTIEVFRDEIKVATKPNGEEVKYVKTQVVGVGEPLFTKLGTPAFNEKGERIITSKDLVSFTGEVYNESGEIVTFEKDKSLVTKDGVAAFDEKGKQITLKNPVIKIIEDDFENFIEKLPEDDHINDSIDQLPKEIEEKISTPILDRDLTEKVSPELLVANDSFKVATPIEQSEKPLLFVPDEKPQMKNMDDQNITFENPNNNSDSNLANNKDIIVSFKPVVAVGTKLFDENQNPVFDETGKQMQITFDYQPKIGNRFDEFGNKISKLNQDNFDKKLFDQFGRQVVDEFGNIELIKENINEATFKDQASISENYDFIEMPISKLGTKLYGENNQPVFYSDGNQVILNSYDDLIDYTNIYDIDGELYLEKYLNKKLFDKDENKVVNDFGKIIKTTIAIKKVSLKEKENFEDKNQFTEPTISRPADSMENANKQIENLKEQLNSLQNANEKYKNENQEVSSLKNLQNDYEDDYNLDLKYVADSKFINDNNELYNGSVSRRFEPKPAEFYDKIETRMNSIENMLKILTGKDKTIDARKIALLQEDIDRIYNDLNDINNSFPSVNTMVKKERTVFSREVNECQCQHNRCSHASQGHIYNSKGRYNQKANNFQIANFNHHHKCSHTQKANSQCEKCGKYVDY
ncbi:hypothetical protein SSABA_v1c08100 [Spiroplasma sabaudiense Ar-1343]|uniref:Uncharacterized protein n=1 Tax=Spiroplasma sabaudiense Ar-1343 TaxID=1276257 RepID=W6AKI1_9MOLU|nr:hypothetical protein [Spiroplasma sabaudiense]AHI54209.1 hypothetical protein SSABA_v1c08100 [Spiroplasma sabaudiense Ar-1343]